MSWEGYFALDDVELINAERVEAYVGHTRWFRPTFNNTALHSVLGDPAYVDPVTDSASWYDSRVAVSKEFFGVYPLDVAGLADSTGQATVTESTKDGGTITAVRRTSKALVYNVLLLGASDAGVEYGKQWLTRALLGLCGSESTADGLTLTYLAAEPYTGAWDGAGACYGRRVDRPTDPFVAGQLLGRSLRRVSVTAPVVITAKQRLSDGCVMWTATFTLTAGNPRDFGVEVPFLDHWLDPAVANPWPYGTAPAGASVSGATTVAEVACTPTGYSPLYDPLCPGIVPPPNPPGIDWGCYTPPVNWTRHIAVIPPASVPGWTEAVPIITVRPAVDNEARNVRLRLYPDPLQSGVVSDECAYSGDVVITYVPEDGVLTLDGVAEATYVDTADGVRRRTDNLVFGSDGSFPVYPVLTCGVQYLAVLDVDPAAAMPGIDITLVERFG